MSIPRRRVLAWFGLMAAAAVGYAWMERRALRRRLLSAALGNEATGPLSVGTVETFRAAVAALLDARVPLDPYLEMFRWRAEHLPGARALYQRWARTLDRRARRRGAPDFRRASLPVRQELLRRYHADDMRTRIRRTLIDRDEARVARHVIRVVFRRFAHTDAWVLAGYAAYPGMPRALVRLGPVERVS